MFDLLAKSNSNAIHNQHFLALAIMSVVVFFPVCKRIGFFPGLLFLWTILNGLRISCFGTSPYSFDLGRFYAFSMGSIRDVLVILFTTFIACSSGHRMVSRILSFISYLSVADAVLMLSGNSGYWYNQSMDASFLVCTLPIFFRKESSWRWLSLIPLMAIVLSGSSTAILSLLLLSIVAFRKLSVIIPVLVAGIVSYPLLPMKHGLFQSSGRVQFWAKAWELFRQHDWFWVGSGTGTFSQWGEFSHLTEQRWIWLHNDWLQIGFEQGAIGLVLVVLVFSKCLWYSRSKSWLFSSIAAFGFCMTTQPMLRNVVGGLYASLLINESRRSHG